MTTDFDHGYQESHLIQVTRMRLSEPQITLIARISRMKTFNGGLQMKPIPIGREREYPLIR
ncbi:MAG: hypothetical protein A2136_03170 [Chloroflexi bacterium RBG_16_54_11]|nr:MAG: hypothetical protein A2136_03170 [Chloroflexi bacterium RBG_16_54_11]